MNSDYQPVLEVTRGGIQESLHFGAAVMVNSQGKLLSSVGNPHLVTFMRSSSKPFQVLPFVEAGGDRFFNLAARELAILCGSHDGSDEHVRVVQGIQSRVGLKEADLLCGVQPPLNEKVSDQLKIHSELPTPNRHNCSGKHTGMLAYARLLGQPLKEYVNLAHPVQQQILASFAEMCDLQPSQIVVGIDGCSVPAFAVPLYNAAFAYARLCDPRDLPSPRASACQRITSAMESEPEMVAGPERFDTRVMKIAAGKLIAKGGAEGFFSLGIFPGALGQDSPGIGVAIKVADGDQKNRVRPAMALEVLRQSNLLDRSQLDALAEFGPTLQVKNWRNLVVGESRPIFQLK